MQKALIFLVNTLLATGAVSAQQGFIAVGGNGSGASGSVNFSVGQPLFQSAGSASGLLIEGLQQPLTSGSPLPLSLLYFNAIANENHTVTLLWATVSEVNTSYFIAERSEDATQFNMLANIKSAGSTNGRQDYQTLDQHPYSDDSYYRLKQVDHDGTVHFSSIQKVHIERAASIKAAPNPANSYVQIIMHDVQPAGYEYRILNDVAGVVRQGIISNDVTTVDMNDLAAASYILQVVKQGQAVKSFKIIKNE